MIINNKLGIHIPEILLPNPSIDLTKWPVVACDQYTSQKDYWMEVASYTGDQPTSLKLILPEVFLEEHDAQQRIEGITKTMLQYLQEGILMPLDPSLIYVERETAHSGLRRGLMVAIDLELYDYKVGSQTLIRATEGTVLDRIPPRMRIREGACLELPHIMVLIDDPKHTVIEPIAKHLDSIENLYDFDLMMNGGHIKGYKVNNTDMMSQIIHALEQLADPEAFYQKYDVGPEKGVLLFAVGDGNHSLATAKACWEDIKPSLSEQEKAVHPARYALVELVNVHDQGLLFEPIHRVLFNIEPLQLLLSMSNYFNTIGHEFKYSLFDTEQDMINARTKLCAQNTAHVIPFIFQNTYGLMQIFQPQCNLEVGTLQAFLDQYVKDTKECYVDYIHGKDAVTKLSAVQGNMGFLLPTMNKHDLFKTVILDGVLPRKTFSMGEADEKRFYLECRRIQI